MGSSCTLSCPGCGYEVHLSVGTGFHGDPFNPETRKDVNEGKYGRKPKAVLETNPKSECYWYTASFHCSCGNYASKESVWIAFMGKTLYRPSKRCSFCHKKMWEIQYLPSCAPCPKCGTAMNETDFLLWD